MTAVLRLEPRRVTQDGLIPVSAVQEAMRHDRRRIFWKARPKEHFANAKAWITWNARFAGREACNLIDSHGYRYGSIFRRKVKAHRIVWLLHHGRWPDGHIDHINGVRDDNRIGNLRDVSQSENSHNQKRPSDNTSGSAGVYQHPNGKWRARIGRGNRHLGYFPSREEAVAAREAAKRNLGYHPAHGIRT